jgi:hypothetical protein
MAGGYRTSKGMAPKPTYSAINIPALSASQTGPGTSYSAVVNLPTPIDTAGMNNTVYRLSNLMLAAGYSIPNGTAGSIALQAEVGGSWVNLISWAVGLSGGVYTATFSEGTILGSITAFRTATTVTGSAVAGTTAPVEVFVLAGGGGGAVSASGSGGGGGGGLIHQTGFLATTSQSTAVTVGAGGAASTQGSNSVFGSLTAVGGGAGGTTGANGGVGGSGGGAGDNSGTPNTGGAATAGQGYAGGNSPANAYAGGGGGAGEVGFDGDIVGDAGNGGDGLNVSFVGQTPSYYGGGGGGWTAFGLNGQGGQGGGGNPNGAGVGTNGLGGGGGGAFTGMGHRGGSGLVMIAIPTALLIPAQGGTGTVAVTSSVVPTVVLNHTIWTFAASGTWQLTAGTPLGISGGYPAMSLDIVQGRAANLFTV